MKKTAIKAAREAGDYLRQEFGRAHEGAIKNRNARDIVTKVDITAEKIITDIIKKQFPRHQILGEEGGKQGPSSDYQWVIDPLDGTGNYSQGLPYFSVSIALLYQQKPKIGIVYNPVTEEFFWTEHNKGAYLNKKRITVSKTKKLSQAFGFFGWGHSQKIIKLGFKQFQNLGQKVYKVRVFGSAALGTAQVGAGKIDFSLIYGVNYWDIAAAALIVEQAGGKVKIDKYGNKLNILATNKYLYSQISKIAKWPAR